MSGVLWRVAGAVSVPAGLFWLADKTAACGLDFNSAMQICTPNYINIGLAAALSAIYIPWLWRKQIIGVWDSVKTHVLGMMHKGRYSLYVRNSEAFLVDTATGEAWHRNELLFGEQWKPIKKSRFAVRK
jgi:hypothetical protein